MAHFPIEETMLLKTRQINLCAFLEFLIPKLVKKGKKASTHSTLLIFFLKKKK